MSQPIRVAIVGSGGREGAIAKQLAAVAKVHVIPGNDFLDNSRKILPQDIKGPDDPDGYDLVVIGPETPLIDGLAERLRHRNLAVVGPDTSGAMLEGSKLLMKHIARDAGIPTALWREFKGPAEADFAEKFLRRQPRNQGYVIKTVKPCAGKGVLVTDSLEAAVADARSKLLGTSPFGPDGQQVIIEQRLTGQESSFIVLCDGTSAIALPGAQDYKRRYPDNHEGLNPNTGGMGAFAPASCPLSGQELIKRFADPVLAELRRRGIEYRGWMYFGLMWTRNGPKLLEINVRLGDPETQVILPLIDSRSLLARLLEAATDQFQGEFQVKPNLFAVTIALVDAGYPTDTRSRGEVIHGITTAEGDGAWFLPAGVKRWSGKLRSTGGRIGYTVGTGSSLDEARQTALRAMRRIACGSTAFRNDIAR